jgi:predicted TIM-barrel fold metal-dependent hydrolase
MRRDSPENPRTPLPPGSWDCHVHIFGDPARFPFAGDRRYTPMRADAADLQRHLDGIGAHKTVIVQASPYGDDNSCLLDALAIMGGRAAGVVALGKDAQRSDAALQELTAAGVRGARLQLRFLPDREATEAIADRAGALGGSGWHMEIYPRRDQLPLIAAAAETRSVPLVLDHFGDIVALDGAGEVAPKAAFRRAMMTGRVWVKLSAPHRVAGLGDAGALAVELTAAYPDRCVWGSDWPHTPPHGEGEGRLQPSPFQTISARRQADLILSALDGATRSAVLKENPQRLYASELSTHTLRIRKA